MTYFSCPQCSGRTVARTNQVTAHGLVRYRTCKACGHKMRTLAVDPSGPEVIFAGRLPYRSRTTHRQCETCEHLATCSALGPAEPVQCEEFLPWELGVEWDDDVDNRQPAISADSVMWLRAA